MNALCPASSDNRNIFDNEHSHLNQLEANDQFQFLLSALTSVLRPSHDNIHSSVDLFYSKDKVLDANIFCGNLKQHNRNMASSKQ